MSDWEDELDVEVEVAIPKKNQWDDEDAEDQVKESWEDSDDEKETKEKKPAPVLKKKVPLKQKIAEKQAAEEKKKQELEAKKLAGEEDKEEEEDAFARKERLRQLELEADMASATDLFSGVAVTDMKDKPLEEWKPRNRVEMDAYRKRLVEIITPTAKWNNYGWFIDELLRDIAVPLNHPEVKKIASSLTTIANEKQRVAKEATKKGKGKSRPQLAAAGKNSTADDNYADNGYDDYDFIGFQLPRNIRSTNTMNEEPIISLNKDEKSHSKNKTVGRISRLFQKKPKKKSSSLAPSASSVSLSEQQQQQGLSKQSNYQSSSSIASSQVSVPQQQYLDASDRNSYLDTRSIQMNNDAASINSKLTRNMSVRSNRSMNIQQMIQQQRQVLRDLDSQKQLYTKDVTTLSEQLSKMNEKIKQRSHDMDLLQNNYQTHLRSVRSSDDTPDTIATKLYQLRQQIHSLANELLPHAEPLVTTEKLSTLWLNLGASIDQLGKPLPPERIQMLTEKFMMDVLVQNLNINVFPGLSCNNDFLVLHQWFDQNDTSTFFSTRLRQELSMMVVQNNTDSGAGDIQQTWKKFVDRNWNHLYRGLQKAYPAYLVKKSDTTVSEQALSVANEYGKKLRSLVEFTMNLGSAIKGQEVCITAVDVREGKQSFDGQLMDDEDGQTNGTIAFCISPPFVVKVANRYEPLLKGRVLCFPSPSVSSSTTASTSPQQKVESEPLEQEALATK
ncbi:eukaryotic translation initiation factor 3 subunit J-like [Mucor ambiguus]|uniref:Eukaryotic translation initiation factor 3 subunit J n=1 Tax=Mucor ambiguus TaxID=91626 RepID=A0A0C9N7B8_9FUNG|nr:eukaryotic translation initiation factor 3 subunit J-like [Mucor ambiguus]